MSDIGTSFYGAPDAHAYAALERRLQVLSDSVFVATPDAVLREFMELRAQVDLDVHALKSRLFGPSLASKEDDKAAGRWIFAQHRRLARVARRMAESFARLAGADEHALRLVALALHYMGESAKGHVRESHYHDGLHALMRIALASGRHREEMQLDVDGRSASCTLASLYFRALLLARLAGGGLTFAQIEILDAWMWIWMPALAGVDDAPEGAAWRADLDSKLGLRRGARADAGPSLYLPEAPLKAALRAIVKEFHAGRTVPANGDISKLAVEDHIAALDTVRRALRQSRRDPAPRAERHDVRDRAELHVGLAEIMAKGFAVMARSAPSLALLPTTGTGTDVARTERGPDSALDKIYDVARRIVQLINVSDTGVGFEGAEADCAELAVGDVVALRLAPGEPMLLGKVVRRLPAATEGRILIGLQRMSSAAQTVRARQPSAGAALPELSLLYLPGDDESGRHDAYLVGEATAAERNLLETTAGDEIFTFHFNRVRERGRGWVMAGFEVTAARRVSVTTGARPAR
jgi:hypothetical protein